MVPVAAKRLRDGLVMVGVGAAALAVLLLVSMAIRANRGAAIDDEAATPSHDSTDRSEPHEVRLNRKELPAAAGIEVEPVQSRAAENAITCNGSAGFNQNKYVKVPPKAEGILGKISVDVGSPVRAGDVLAVVNSQVVGDLKASYLKAIVHEEHLRWQVERYKAVAEGIAAKNLFESQHLLEEQLTDTARIRDRLGVYGFSAAQVEQIAHAKDMGVQLPVVAPRDGVIVQRQAVEGEPASTQAPLFAIADLDTMWVHLNVYESHLPYIHLGQEVTFFPDGLPGQGFAGTVTWVSPEVDVHTRTIQLRAEVTNRDRALRANMFGKGELLVEQPQARVVVPPQAVQSHHGAHVVFVQKPDNLFEVRQVEIGLKNDKFWEVTSGLRPGEKVATVGSFLLKSNLENPQFGKVE
jgi:membrane fusion protein, heavy metal efflux system